MWCSNAWHQVKLMAFNDLPYTDLTSIPIFCSSRLAFDFSIKRWEYCYMYIARYFSNNVLTWRHCLAQFTPHQIPDITTLFITLHSQGVMFVTSDIRFKLKAFNDLPYPNLISIPIFCSSHLAFDFGTKRWEYYYIYIYYTYTHSTPFLKQCSHTASLPSTIQMFVPVSLHHPSNSRYNYPVHHSSFPVL